MVKKKKSKMKSNKKKGQKVKKPASRKMVKKRNKKTAIKHKKKFSAIPQGYHSVTPCLTVKQADVAIKFYIAALGAKEIMRLEKPDGKIAYAELRIGDARIMIGEECPESDARSPESYGGSPMSIYLYVKQVDAVVEKAIAAGAKLVKSVEHMFYGDRCGVLLDPYGYRWHVATHVEDVSPAKIKKRAAEVFAKKAAV